MQRISFNDHWQFKALEANEFMPVTLPHDAMQTEHPSSQAASGPAGAYYPGNQYLYQKKFSVPDDWKHQQVLLEVGGIYQKATIILNGHVLKHVIYGYRPFMVNLTPSLQLGENQLQVKVDNAELPNSRWYSGAGIYRSVWLWHGDTRLTTNDVQITTLAVNPAKIRVQIKSLSDNWQVQIMDGTQLVASGQGQSIDLKIPQAKLWSADTPFLYRCRVQHGNDQLEIPFGIRKLEWRPQAGLLVNGTPTLLRGGCLHPDNGIVGAASYRESEFRKIKRLKDSGFNAIRSAHNPASTELLEACDQLGMYVMDEMWDMWYQEKNEKDYAADFLENYQDDVADVVQRDFNHPAVIMYSIGNEISEPAKSEGVVMAQKIVQLFHKLDATRPTTAGINLMILGMAASGQQLIPGDGQKSDQVMDSTAYNQTVMAIGTQVNKFALDPSVDQATAPMLDTLDIAGYNYGTARYDLDQSQHPQRLIVGTETYPQNLSTTWQKVKRLPNVIGDFMWTAWDYIGEVGIGAWSYSDDAADFFKPYPWKLADAGAFDLNGQPTGEALWAKAIWHQTTEPLIAVRPVGHEREPYKSAWRGTNAIPSWSWTNCEGKLAKVEVYFGCASVILELNGHQIGEQPIEDTRAIFEVPYQPGKLVAKALNAQHQVVATSELQTAGDSKLHWRYEDKLTHDDVHYVDVWLGDDQGNFIGNSADQIQIDTQQLLGFGSARPRTTDDYRTASTQLYQGRALAVLTGPVDQNLKVTLVSK